MKQKRFYFLQQILLLTCLSTYVLLPLPTLAQSAPAITYERYDSEITIQPDGTFRVREIQQIRFDDEFQSAFAEIPGELVSGLDAIQLYEGDDPYREGTDAPGTFTNYWDGDLMVVEWYFTPTSPGDVRTFVLEYVVEGGLWIYPDEQVLEWRAVPADRSGIPVEESTVTVTVPESVSVTQLQYTAYGPEYTAATTEDGVIFTATEPLPDGVAFQVQVGLPVSATGAVLQAWQQQEDAANLDYRYRSVDVEIFLTADGTLQVEERHQISVDAGALDKGDRVIPTAYLDSISEVSLTEGGQAFTESNSPCDYCFQVITEPRRADWVRYDEARDETVVNTARAGAVRIDWQFPPLVRGETTTFTLRYAVEGAIQLLAEEQRLAWQVVFADPNAPVQAASLQLHLPAAVTAEEVTVAGGVSERIDANTIRVVAADPIAPGGTWDVRFAFPPDALAVSKSAWQTAMEAAVLEAQTAAARRARAQLGFGVIGLLLALLGPLGVYLLWYTRGRDLPIPAVADYLAEPPSDLPPAIVAYLLDEEPSTKGALASLFHLATLGLLSIRFDGQVAVKRLVEEDVVENEELVTPEGATVRVPPHLATLFNALKPEMPLDEEVALTKLNRHFQAQLPLVYSQMGKEATHFFDELPPTARHRWLVRGQWVVILAIIAAGLLAVWYVGAIGWVAVLPALALVLTGGTLIVVSRWMPRRTEVGVEEAARWRAFRTYLRNLKQYATVDDAQRILDRYFAYAVAFDVEKVLLRQVEALGGRLPPWTYTPTWQPPRRPYRPRYPQRSGQPTNVPTTLPSTLPPIGTFPRGGTDVETAGERPSLSGMSRNLGNALSNASSNLGTLLSQAAGPGTSDTPFDSIQSASRTGGKVAATTLDVLGEILSESSSGGGSGGYRSSGSSRSSWSSSRSRSSSRSASRSSTRRSSSGRSSSSRRSGGGGRRGFR